MVALVDHVQVSLAKRGEKSSTSFVAQLTNPNHALCTAIQFKMQIIHTTAVWYLLKVLCSVVDEVAHSLMGNSTLHPPSRCRRSRLSKRLPSSHTLRIKIRPLAQTDSSLTSTGPIVVVSRGVIHRAVVPDRQIIRVCPSVTNLEIVVLSTVSFGARKGRVNGATHSRQSTA